MPGPASAYGGTSVARSDWAHIFRSVSYLLLVSHGSLVGGSL